MLSKCANPGCSAQFRYLHLGKLFHLCPIPELDKINEDCSGELYERFWLCQECCQKFTVIWDGVQAQVVPVREHLPKPTVVVAEEEQQAESAEGCRMMHEVGTSPQD